MGHEDALFRDIRHASWAPDGASLLVTVDYGGNQEIDQFASDGAFLGPIVRSPGYEAMAHWSAKQDEILYQTDRDAEDGPAFSLYSIRPDGADLGRRVMVDFSVMFGRWSPDGSSVVFNDVAGAGPRQIHLLDVSTSLISQLTRSEEFHHDFPSWSPDGTEILFESTRGGAWDVYRMRPDGSDIREVGLGGAAAPRYSPDGSMVSFHELTNGLDYDVFVANADGSDVRTLAGGAGDQRLPEWSPDGRALAYISNSQGHHDLFVVQLEDETHLQLTHQPSAEFFGVLESGGMEAARELLESARSSSPERSIIRDARAIFLAISRARSAGDAAESEFLLELGLSVFPDSQSLLSIREEGEMATEDY